MSAAALGTSTALKHSRDMRWQGGQTLSGVLGDVLLMIMGVRNPIYQYKQTHHPTHTNSLCSRYHFFSWLFNGST